MREEAAVRSRGVTGDGSDGLEPHKALEGHGLMGEEEAIEGCGGEQ